MPKSSSKKIKLMKRWVSKWVCDLFERLIINQYQGKKIWKERRKMMLRLKFSKSITWTTTTTIEGEMEKERISWPRLWQWNDRMNVAANRQIFNRYFQESTWQVQLLDFLFLKFNCWVFLQSKFYFLFLKLIQENKWDALREMANGIII